MKKLIALFVVLALALSVAIPFALAVPPDDDTGPVTLSNGGGTVGIDPDFPDEDPYLVDLSDPNDLEDWLVYLATDQYVTDPLGVNHTLGRYIPYVGNNLWFGDDNVVPYVRIGGVLVNREVTLYSGVSDPLYDPLNPHANYDGETWKYLDGMLFSIFVRNPTSVRDKVDDGAGNPVDPWYTVNVSVGDFEIDDPANPGTLIPAIDDFTLTLADVGNQGVATIPTINRTNLNPGPVPGLANDYMAAISVDLVPNDPPEAIWSFNAASGDAIGNLWFSNYAGKLVIAQGGIKEAGVSDAVITVDLDPYVW